MPGVFAIVDENPGADASELLTRMLQRAAHHPWYIVQRHADAAAGVALGRVSLGVVDTAPQPVASDDGSLVVVMDGELYDHAARRRALETAGCELSGDSHAEILLRGYRREGKAFFAGLNGKFVAAIWDRARRKLILANDRFGMRLLYYAARPGRFLAASEIKAILLDPLVSRKPNERGLAQFFTYGQYLGDDTSFEAIRVLPPAGWLEYDAAADRVDVDRYWRLDAEGNDAARPGDLLEQIDAAFQRAVDCRTRDTEHLGIALSGGLDARTILAAIDQDRAPVTSVALGIAGCGDHRSASQLASLAGCQHHNYVLNNAFLADFETHLNQMVYLTDGQYLSTCIVMPTLPFYRELGIGVLLRGHAGELMHMSKAYNYSLDGAALRIRDEAGLREWTFGHLQGYMLDGVRGPLLASRDRAAFDALARESLDDCLAESAAVNPPLQRIWRLFTTQRVRREITLSLMKFGSWVETRLPYLDNDLVDLLMVAPPEMKLDEMIQAHILRRLRPGFLDVVNVNTGTRLGASSLAKKAASFRQRVLAKLRVRGYQPYERMGLWLRHELRPIIERLLLDDRCLGRGVFCPDTVRAVVGEHLRNERNHTYLLLAMMISELGQRRLVDGEASPEHAETRAR
jgi:asparagine synthase (glutamine-hydrolysing)